MGGKKEKVLITTVIETDDNGQPVIFNKGDVPEKKYADLIGDHAWGYLDADGNVVEDASDAADPDEVADDEEPDGAEDDVVVEDPDNAEEPPRSGKGSGVKAWAEFAATKGVELDDDATAKDYQDAVDAL